jgi:hypothetical protein
MLKSIKKFFGFGASAATEVTTQAVPSAPYKVPEPAATTPIPLVVEAIVPVEAVAPVAPVTKAPAKPRAVKKPVAAATAKPKAVKKPAAPKAKSAK